MSQENVEVVRAQFLAWNEGDMDGLCERYDPDAIRAWSGRLAVRVRWSGEGQGPEIRMEFTNVSTLRKGRTFYLEHFWDHAEALGALGLSE